MNERTDGDASNQRMLKAENNIEIEQQEQIKERKI
jgi:hypothetical protein